MIQVPDSMFCLTETHHLANLGRGWRAGHDLRDHEEVIHAIAMPWCETPSFIARFARVVSENIIYIYIYV